MCTNNKAHAHTPAKGSTDDGFKYRCDERASLHWFKERNDGGRQRGRGFRGGTCGDQRGISESIPCWTVRELVTVSKHENKHRQMWRRPGLHAKLCRFTHTLLSVYTKRQTSKHIIITDENTKINVINTLASEEISPSCFLCLTYSQSSPLSFPLSFHTSSCLGLTFRGFFYPKCLTEQYFFFLLLFVSMGGPSGNLVLVCGIISFFWVTQGFNKAWSCWVTLLIPKLWCPIFTVKVFKI